MLTSVSRLDSGLVRGREPGPRFNFRALESVNRRFYCQRTLFPENGTYHDVRSKCDRPFVEIPRAIGEPSIRREEIVSRNIEISTYRGILTRTSSHRLRIEDLQQFLLRPWDAPRLHQVTASLTHSIGGACCWISLFCDHFGSRFHRFTAD